MIIEDTLPEDEAAEIAAAEAAAEAAYDAEYAWQGQRLEPLTIERYAIWQRMETHHCAVPDGEPQLSLARLPSAWSLLWLCSQQADVILAYMASGPLLYWYAVYGWAGKHCPANTALPALQLMQQLLRDSEATQTVVRAMGGSPGNVPSPVSAH